MYMHGTVIVNTILTVTGLKLGKRWLSIAVFKYMAKQAMDCRNMVVTVVWRTHTTVWLLKKLQSTYFNVLYA